MNEVYSFLNHIKPLLLSREPAEDELTHMWLEMHSTNIVVRSLNQLLATPSYLIVKLTYHEVIRQIHASGHNFIVLSCSDVVPNNAICSDNILYLLLRDNSKFKFNIFLDYINDCFTSKVSVK